MLKEKNPLLKLKFEKEKSFFIKFYNSFTEAFYCLFDLIMEDPIESLWFECFHIFFGYTQIIAYLFEPLELYI